MNILGFFQRLGRALQLPIAVLPVAALLLRFGQPDLLNVAFIAQAGGAIFDNLALIFASGVASSWSKDSAGAAALAGAVGYFVLTKAMVTINPEINMGAAVFADLFRRQFINVRQAFIDQFDRIGVELIKIIGGVTDVTRPVKT